MFVGTKLHRFRVASGKSPPVLPRSLYAKDYLRRPTPELGGVFPVCPSRNHSDLLRIGAGWSLDIYWISVHLQFILSQWVIAFLVRPPSLVFFSWSHPASIWEDDTMSMNGNHEFASFFCCLAQWRWAVLRYPVKPELFRRCSKLLRIPRHCWYLFPTSTFSASRGFLEVRWAQYHERTSRTTHLTWLLSKHRHTPCAIMIPGERMWMC